MTTLLNSAEIARDWVSYWQKQLETDRFPDSEASSALDQLAQTDPDTVWEVILAILSMIDAQPSSRLFQVLAAGPVEDLLSHHGDLFIARVEKQAHADERFKLLLGGVWKNEMSESTWARVQACRGEAW